METVLIFIVTSILLFFIITRIAIRLERKDFNNGICKCCGKPLRHFDTDSQGCRLYTCENYCCLVSVSYDSVDGDYSEMEE